MADPAPFDELGHSWRITELSCKPFPSGRATHGGIDAWQRLMREQDITAERVVALRFCVPPLTARLIGRPITKLMTPNYARLCLQYVGAVCLRRGTLGLDDFTAEALGDPQTLALAHRLQVVVDPHRLRMPFCRCPSEEVGSDHCRAGWSMARASVAICRTTFPGLPVAM
jgi:2-methylcitrate dehydratase PrpD